MIAFLCFLFGVALGCVLTRIADHRRQTQAVKRISEDRLYIVWRSPSGTRRN